MKIRKWLLSIMLILAICITTMPLQYISVYAEEISETSGSCGDNLTWSITGDGTLIISGTGKMDSWGSNNSYKATPWENFSENVTSVVIEEGVTSIGGYAFGSCNNLINATIPESITEIGDGAFRSCSKLYGIVIPKNVKSIGNYAFSGCSTLDNIIIPTSVESIGDDAFWYCSRLVNVAIEEGVISIGKYAFAKTGLINVNIPSSVSEIGEGVFSRCDDLEKITVSENNMYICVLDGVLFNNNLHTLIYAPNTLESYIIPDGTERIGSYAFSGCEKLKDITLPDSIMSVGSYAFSDTALYSDILRKEGIVYLGNCLIDARKVKDEYNIKEGTVVIADYAFDWSEIKEVHIPDSVVTIGDGAFHHCMNLTEIIIPNNVTKIGKMAFCLCSALTEITIPSNVAIIGEDAFWECRSITTLNVTGGTYKLEWGIIEEFTNLKDINYERTPIDYGIADNTNETVNYAKSKSINLNNIQDSTYSNRSSYLIYGFLDQLQETKAPNGDCFAFYGYEDDVIVVSEYENETPIKISNEGFTFGAATIGDDGYYYVMWGKSISDDVFDVSLNEENIQICKYDNSGRLIKTLGLPVSYTDAQFLFEAGNANISYNAGYLCVIFNMEWTYSYSNDGLHHQGSQYVGIDAETMTLVGYSKWQGSHSFGVSMIPTVYGFAAVQRGDAGCRGININSYYIENGQVTANKKNGRNILFHSSGQYGSNAHHMDGNATYTYMGGLAMSNSTYAVAGKSERVYTSDIFKNSDLHTEVYDVFVKIADGSLITDGNFNFAGTSRIDEVDGKVVDKNIIWLTNCNEKEKAATVKIVTLPSGAYCVLWEKMVEKDNKLEFDSIHYVILDECGNILRKETTIYGARLSDTSIQPIVKGNTLTWAVVYDKRKTLTWYSVDLDLQEEYDENRTITSEYVDNISIGMETPVPLPSIMPTATPENNAGVGGGNVLIIPEFTTVPTSTPTSTPIQSPSPSSISDITHRPLPTANIIPTSTPKSDEDDIGTIIPIHSHIPDIISNETNDFSDSTDDSNSDIEMNDLSSTQKITEVSINGVKYKKISKGNKEIMQVIGIKKNFENAVIYSNVKISDKSYKVTSISPNAFKENKRLKWLTIGSNIDSIGKNAFKGCKNLKEIEIKSKKLTIKNTGSNAFKGISKKVIIKVPKGKVKLYKKIIKKKGAGKNVKVIK